MTFPLGRRAIIIGLVSALFIAFNTADSKAEETGKIIDVEGSVEIQHPGQNFWMVAEKGMILTAQDRIKTSVGAEVEIALDSTLKNMVRLQPDTEISLEDLKGKRLYMPKGEILALLEGLPAGSCFEVRTPSAVAGVAGSGLAVDTDGRTTYVKCFKDRVYARGINPDGTPMSEVVYIDEGYKSLIEEFQAPGGLITLTPPEIERWSRFIAKVKRRVKESLEKAEQRYKDHPDLKEFFE